ncbi:MAG TPA: hypothetical protein VE779_02315 [Candidatus Angelobacter sp.]|nr:hypothetical protein [Candidatus Angelobacter sp.]
MVRVLVLIAVMIFCREVVVRKRRRLLTANPPYMNALDGAMSAQQLSLAIEETAKYRSHAGWRHALR